MTSTGGGKQPTTWDEYDRGGRTSSIGSGGSRIHWDEIERRPSGSSNLGAHRQSDHSGHGQELRRRR